MTDSNPKMLSLTELADSFVVKAGTLDPDKLTAFGIFRNERFFLASFLAHHRSIGIEQFVIVDDNSDDGTAETLAAEHDCVVLGSPYSFGEVVTHDFGSRIRKARAGQLMKSAVPQRFLPGRWALYVDADEFLFLPPGLSTVQELVARLEAHGASSVLASMVDFYPEKLPESHGEAPADIEGLFSETPYFDARPLFTFDPKSDDIRVLYEGSTTRIVQLCRINDVPWPFKYAPHWIRRMMKRGQLTLKGSAIRKTPLVRWDPGVRYITSHKANVPPMPGLILALAHFKLSSDIHRRIDMAIELGSYMRNSYKYKEMQSAFSAESARGISFLTSRSRKFQTAQDFLDCQLMTVPDGF